MPRGTCRGSCARMGAVRSHLAADESVVDPRRALSAGRGAVADLVAGVVSALP